MRTKLVPLIAFFLGALVALAGAAAAQSEDPNPTAPRWAEADYEISLGEDLQEIGLEGEVGFHKIQTSDRTLQRQCGGSTCTADDIREAYQRAGDSGKQRIVDEIESRIESRIQAALGGLGASDVEATADASEDSLAEPTDGSEYQPPIPVDAQGSGQLSFADDVGVTSDQVAALFQMGAEVDKEIEVPVEAGTNLTLTLSVPAPVGVLDADVGQIAGDGRQITWEETNWQSSSQSTIEDQITLGDPSVEVPDETDAEVEVTLDISEVDVAYTSLLGDGQPAEARVGVSVDGSFGAIENPRELERVQLDYLSADAVRLALDAGLLDERQLISVEDRARKQIKQTFEGMTGEQVEVTGGFRAEDLSGDAVGEPVGTGDPIELRLEANTTMPFPPQQAAQGTASGFTVTTLSIGSLDLPQIDTPYDVDATITLVLPQGLDLAFEGPEGYTVEPHTVDGRQAYTFSPDGGASEGEKATIQNGEVVVNHPFVWDVFWPLLLTLVLLLVILPAVVIGLTIRRRRKYGPPTAEESQTPVSGSQSSQRVDASEE